LAPGLSAANDTYSGTTTVANGTLALSGSYSNNIANSTTIDVQVGAGLSVSGLTGGTLVLANNQTLKGNGTVTGKLTAGSGSHVAPGASVGHLTQNGDDTFNSGANLDIEIEGKTPATYDHVDVTGAVAVNGATLNLTSASYTPRPNDKYIFISNDGSDAVTGTGFVAGAPVYSGDVALNTPLPEGAVVSTNFLGSGNTAWITYKGGDGNDVAIQVNGRSITRCRPQVITP